MEMVPPEGDNTISRTSTDNLQCNSRPGVPDSPLHSRVEPEQAGISQSDGLSGPMQGGHFCNKTEPNQFPLYVTLRPNSYAMATDAFQVKWTHLQAYAFHSSSLIGRCLQEICQEGGNDSPSLASSSVVPLAFRNANISDTTAQSQEPSDQISNRVSLWLSIQHTHLHSGI